MSQRSNALNRLVPKSVYRQHSLEQTKTQSRKKGVKNSENDLRCRKAEQLGISLSVTSGEN